MTAQEVRVESVRVEHLRAAARYSTTVRDKMVADHEAKGVELAAALATLNAEIAECEAKIEGGG